MSPTEPLALVPPGRPMTSLERQMHEDSAWAMDHYQELDRQYRGQFVVVWKKQVVAHGQDLAELFKHAVGTGCPREELVLVAVPDPFFDLPH
jgi:hypothetical protein